MDEEKKKDSRLIKLLVCFSATALAISIVTLCLFIFKQPAKTTVASGRALRSMAFKDLPGCETHPTPVCPGSSGDMEEKWKDHLWNTPPRGSSGWKAGFQDMNVLQGYAQLLYSSDHNSCTVTIITKLHHNMTLAYYFDGKAQETPSKSFDSSYKQLLHVKVVAQTGETLELDEIDFLWNVESLNVKYPSLKEGKKGAIIEMFGWPDEDVEQECKRISEAGYLGVKLFPHQEQLMSDQPFQDELNPWSFMFQPVSYRLQGRMGSRTVLRKMIKTCRSLGVRVYADAVVNHMTGAGNDAQEHRNNNGACTTWPAKQSSAEDTQSPFYTASWTYQTNSWGNPNNVYEFPAVPYGPMDFHCEKSLNSWTDPNILNTGWLVGLSDLDTSKDFVRQRIADFFVDLLSIGFTGFRVDAAKHIHPNDLAAIFAKFKKQLGGNIPTDWITWLEVLTGGEASLLVRDSEYSYTVGLERALKEQGFTEDEIIQVKVWWCGYPSEPENDAGTISKKRKVIENDDHDQQNPGSSSRDMHDCGCVLVKGCEPSTHRGFEVKLFSNPYGDNINNDVDYPIRLVLSSYYFVNNVMSIPDGKSDCKKCKQTCESCRTREYVKAYQEDAKSYPGEASGGYTYVHRDAEIINAMQKWMKII